MAGDSSTLKKCSTSSIPSTPNKKKSNEEKPAQKFASEGTFTKKFSNEEYSPRKVSNESAKKLSCEESPAKSRIPVLRSSSYRVPKTISFGFGVQKVFPMHGKKSGNMINHFRLNVGRKASQSFAGSEKLGMSVLHSGRFLYELSSTRHFNPLEKMGV
jgi:hypothetical protein